MQSLVVLDEYGYGVGFSTGISCGFPSYAHVGILDFNASTNQLYASVPTEIASSKGRIINGTIDFSAYKKLCVSFAIGDLPSSLVADISAINLTGYVAVLLARDGSGGYMLGIYAISENTSLNNILVQNTTSITTGTAYITRIWLE